MSKQTENQIQNLTEKWNKRGLWFMDVGMRHIPDALCKDSETSIQEKEELRALALHHWKEEIK